MFGHIHANGPYLSIPHTLLERTFILTIVEGNSRKLLTFVPGIIRGVEKRATFRGYSGTPRDSCYWQGGRGVLLREYKMDPSVSGVCYFDHFADTPSWEDLRNSLRDSWEPFEYSPLVSSAKRSIEEEEEILDFVLPMGLIKELFQWHFPALAEKLNSSLT